MGKNRRLLLKKKLFVHWHGFEAQIIFICQRDANPALGACWCDSFLETLFPPPIVFFLHPLLCFLFLINLKFLSLKKEKKTKFFLTSCFHRTMSVFCPLHIIWTYFFCWRSFSLALSICSFLYFKCLFNFLWYLNNRRTKEYVPENKPCPLLRLK